MDTRLTVIVDNNACDQLAGEWGLSILIEHNNKKILLDVGASELFLKNMRMQGIDVSEIDYAVLSHAHFDHANGMPAFFSNNASAKFFIRESTAENCFIKKFIFHKYIGIPKNVLADFRDRIETVSGDYKLCDGVYLIPHKMPELENMGKREKMYQRTADGWMPDNFSHEQSVVLDTEKGLIIINCCSHGGVATIIKEVNDTFPDKHIYGYVGGLHLYNKTEAEILTTAQDIKKSGIDYICTGHCTKERAFEILKNELGEKIEQLHVGKIIEF